MAFLSFIKIRRIPRKYPGKSKRVVFILFFLSFVFYVLARIVPSKEAEALTGEMLAASEVMKKALVLVKNCREEKEVMIDPRSDLNLTGLIGVNWSSITTSLGNLEAKRTTTNPNFAALVVFLLRQSGVSQGDIIAVGASGSFPGLIMAVLSASKAMGLEPVLISSLGASQWGANIPEFNWLHMYYCLSRAGMFNWSLAAVSLGGEQDRALNMAPEGRTLLLREIESNGLPFLRETNLRHNVTRRMQVYTEKSSNRAIKAFINIGGSWANVGTDPGILELKPGLVKLKHLPPPEMRGVLHEMALRKIPVIHFLNVRGLVKRYFLSWDPVPLPEPGEDRIFSLVSEMQPSFIFLATAYFFLVFLVFFFHKLYSSLPKNTGNIK